MDPIAGVVRSKGLHDELTGQSFMVSEATNGRIRYTRVDLRTAERIVEGDIVRLAVGPRLHVVAGQQEIGGKPKARSPVPFRRLGPPLHFQQRYKGPAWLDTPEAAAVATSGLDLPARLRDLCRAVTPTCARWGWGGRPATASAVARVISQTVNEATTIEDSGQTRRSDSAGLSDPGLAPPSTRGADPVLSMVLTPDELAQMLRVRRRFVYEVISRGDIPGVRRIGRKVPSEPTLP